MGGTGLEPVTSCVSSRRLNISKYLYFKVLWFAILLTCTHTCTETPENIKKQAKTLIPELVKIIHRFSYPRLYVQRLWLLWGPPDRNETHVSERHNLPNPRSVAQCLLSWSFFFWRYPRCNHRWNHQRRWLRAQHILLLWWLVWHFVLSIDKSALLFPLEKLFIFTVHKRALQLEKFPQSTAYKPAYKENQKKQESRTEELPSDLAEIVAVWSKLPEHIKQAIKALIQTV